MRLPSRLLVALVVILTFGLLGSGCNFFARRNSAATAGNRVAIALTVNGTEQPTPQQWATLINAIEAELAVYGLVLVDDLALADRILRIDFTPSFTDPNTGRAVVLGWRANPLRSVTYASAGSTPVYRTSYTSGLSTYYNSTFGYERYPDYYGYSSGYAGGSSGGSTTAPANPPDKPTHPETHRGDCLPGTTPPASGGHGRYAGGELPRHPDRGHRPEPPTPSPGSTSSSGGYSSYSSGSSSSPSYSSSSSSSSGSYSSGSSGSSGSYSSSSASTSTSSSSSSSSYGGQPSSPTKER